MTQVTQARRNGRSRQPNLKVEFFRVNKYLIRYTERLRRINEDDRWSMYVADLAETYDSDLERMEKQIRKIRKEFAAATKAAATKGEQ